MQTDGRHDGEDEGGRREKGREIQYSVMVSDTLCPAVHILVLPIITGPSFSILKLKQGSRPEADDNLLDTEGNFHMSVHPSVFFEVLSGIPRPFGPSDSLLLGLLTLRLPDALKFFLRPPEALLGLLRPIKAS